MKKLIGIALVVALAVMLMPGAVFAWDPVSVEVNWGGGAFDAGGYPVDFGAGYIGATITAQDDATSTIPHQRSEHIRDFYVNLHRKHCVSLYGRQHAFEQN